MKQEVRAFANEVGEVLAPSSKKTSASHEDEDATTRPSTLICVHDWRASPNACAIFGRLEQALQPTETLIVRLRQHHLHVSATNLHQACLKDFVEDVTAAINQAGAGGTKNPHIVLAGVGVGATLCGLVAEWRAGGQKPETTMSAGMKPKTAQVKSEENISAILLSPLAFEDFSWEVGHQQGRLSFLLFGDQQDGERIICRRCFTTYIAAV